MNPVRIRDLPLEERAPFSAWLKHQACPMLPGVPDEEQDGAYMWDYQRWLELRNRPQVGRSYRAESHRGQDAGRGDQFQV